MKLEVPAKIIKKEEDICACQVFPFEIKQFTVTCYILLILTSCIFQIDPCKIPTKVNYSLNATNSLCLQVPQTFQPFPNTYTCTNRTCQMHSPSSRVLFGSKLTHTWRPFLPNSVHLRALNRLPLLYLPLCNRAGSAQTCPPSIHSHIKQFWWSLASRNWSTVCDKGKKLQVYSFTAGWQEICENFSHSSSTILLFHT